MSSLASKAPAAARGFIEFVNASPSPFHAVAEAAKRLDAAGFTKLRERESWDGQLKVGGKYYFTRNASSLIAFVVGNKYAPGNGFHIVAAHTDSPCLKVKPVSKKVKSGYMAVGVQTYGGGLFNTWFDRDLGIAGRVIVKGTEHKLVRINDPILRIPTLAIHLDRDVANGFSFNKETHLLPVLCSVAEAELNNAANPKDPEPGTGAAPLKHHSLLLSRLAEQLNCAPEDIDDVELCLYDVQPATIGGALAEYVFAPRCDNLLMSYCGLEAVLAHASDATAIAGDEGVAMVALFDNEEVGSNSAYGADSHYCEATLRRITTAFGTPKSSSAFLEAMQKSFLVSADMAHAIHCNYPEKHEPDHAPRMNAGLTIKLNANQRYATTGVTSALLRKAAKAAGAKLQEFVVRNDSPCGSTIGPILSGKLGMRTIDVGNPQLSMHSIREQAGTKDIGDSIAIFKAFYKGFAQFDKEIIVD